MTTMPDTKLKDLPREQWEKLAALLREDGIELDPEMTLEEAIALGKAEAERQRLVAARQRAEADMLAAETEVMLETGQLTPEEGER
jgi:hypothetical protein